MVTNSIKNMQLQSRSETCTVEITRTLVQFHNTVIFKGEKSMDGSYANVN